MQRFCTLASGSGGNCALLTDNTTNILIDAGISMRRIKAGLASLGTSPDELSAVFITHDHSDHVAGLPMLIKYFPVPVYTSVDTGRRLLERYPALRPVLRLFKPDTAFVLEGMEITPFKTPHDAPGSVGCAASLSCGKRFVLATDLGYIPENVMEHILSADFLMLEANHDRKMLMSGPYPPFLKDRILGQWGHLSNDSCGSVAAAAVKHGLKHILLAHLSRENNTPQLALTSVSAVMADNGVKIYSDVEIDVVPAQEAGKEYIL